jgi:hypothetical protein
MPQGSNSRYIFNLQIWFIPGAFEKPVRKSCTILVIANNPSVRPSLCPSLRVEQRDSHRTDSHEIAYLELLLKCMNFIIEEHRYVNGRMSEESCCLSVVREGYFSLFQSVQSSTVAHWTSFSIDPAVLSPTVKWFGQEVDCIPHISARHDEWSSAFTPLHLHDLHGDNITLYLMLLRCYVNFKSVFLLHFLRISVLIVWRVISCSSRISTHSIRTVWRVTAVVIHVTQNIFSFLIRTLRRILCCRTYWKTDCVGAV